MYIVREYRAEDAEQVECCIIELQNFERTLEADRVEGTTIAKRELHALVDVCNQKSGRLFVVEVDKRVVGFIGIRLEHDSENHLSDLTDYAYISDVVVLGQYRGMGLGKALMERAEQYARGQGARVIKIGVLARNHRAMNVYRSAGFRDYELILLKELSE